MNEKSVVSKYLEYRENVLKYTNIDMNLELENDEQVYIAVLIFLQKVVFYMGIQKLWH